jgi:hypothetical protein
MTRLEPAFAMAAILVVGLIILVVLAVMGR